MESVEDRNHPVYCEQIEHRCAVLTLNNVLPDMNALNRREESLQKLDGGLTSKAWLSDECRQEGTFK